MLNKYFLAFFLGLLAITCFGMITTPHISMVLEVALDVIKGISTFVICILFLRHRKRFSPFSLATLGLPCAGFFVLALCHIYRTVVLHCGGGFYDNVYWHYCLIILMLGLGWEMAGKKKDATKAK